MTSEIAGELISRGHRVSVLHLNWNAQRGSTTRILNGAHGEKIIDVAPRALGSPGSLVYKISKFLFSNLHARREMQKHFVMADYDATVSWTPGIAVGMPLRSAIRGGIQKHILFVFDFFPIHHLEIGLIPAGFVYRVAKSLENYIYRKFTAIICNFPGNINFLIENYPIRRNTRVLSTPLWSDISALQTEPRADVRLKYELPVNRPIAIFGGQITEGRGIEQMLAAAEYAHQRHSSLLFLFVGNGRLEPVVAAKAKELDNVMHIPGVSRDEYLDIVNCCDIGMVATVKGVSSFSFPTKTIDYLRADLKIVAAVEKGSDYLKLLSKYNIGAAVDFDDAEGYFEVAEQLVVDMQRENGIAGTSRRCLEEVFHVRHSADVLLEAVS